MRPRKITTKQHARRFNAIAKKTKKINKGKYRRGGIRL